MPVHCFAGSWQNMATRKTTGKIPMSIMAVTLLLFFWRLHVAHGITGGVETKGEALVWTVAIGDARTPTADHRCIGTLLSNEWILTTASCLKNFSVPDLRVYAGCRKGSTKSCSQTLSVEKTFLHPCFNNSGRATDQTATSMKASDIALMKLLAPGVAVGGKTRFPLLDKVVNGAYTTPADSATISGWGITGYDLIQCYSDAHT
eukprot:Stramenopile-MAST_4_protein_5282